MDVLIVHNRFHHYSGPETYMFNLIRALEYNGSSFGVFALDYSINQKSPWSDLWPQPRIDDYSMNNQSVIKTLCAARHALSDKEVENKFFTFCTRYRPKSIIFLQFTLKLSNTVIKVADSLDIPYSIRLSDFGYFCINGTLTLNGRFCDLCTVNKIHGVLKNCGGSYAKSSYLFLNLLNFRHQLGSSFRGFLVPSKSTIEQYQKSDLGDYPYNILPSLYVGETNEHSAKRHKNAGYFGRISADKTLSDEMLNQLIKRKINLSLFGKISSRELKRTGIARLYSGELDYKEVRDTMRQFKVVVFVANWLDNLPNTLIESLSMGCLVVVPRKGSYLEYLENKEFAFFYNNEYEFTDAINSAIENFDTNLSTKAICYARETFGMKNHLKKLKEYGII